MSAFFIWCGMDYRGFFEITKVDEETRTVSGYGTTEAVDADKEVIDLETVRRLMPEYMNHPALWEMHQPNVAGSVIEWDEKDDKGIPIKAHVTDDQAWAKVKAGDYRGFSIRGPLEKRVGNRVFLKAIREFSLVDKPCNPDSEFAVVKGQGLDADETNESFRFRQQDPDAFQADSFRTINIGTKIKAVVGKKPDGDSMEIQSYIFPKESWTEADARAWVASHTKQKEESNMDAQKIGEALKSAMDGVKEAMEAHKAFHGAKEAVAKADAHKLYHGGFGKVHKALGDLAKAAGVEIELPEFHGEPDGDEATKDHDMEAKEAARKEAEAKEAAAKASTFSVTDIQKMVTDGIAKGMAEVQKAMKAAEPEAAKVAIFAIDKAGDVVKVEGEKGAASLSEKSSAQDVIKFIQAGNDPSRVGKLLG